MAKQRLSGYVYVLGFFLLFPLSPTALANPDGEQVYMQNCLVCHAEDGNGAMPGVKDLSVNKEWSIINETQLLQRLKNGIQTPGASMVMPPRGGNPDLSDDDLKAVITYMRATFIK